LLHAAAIRTLPENSAVPETLAHGEADAVFTTTFEAPRWSRGLDGVETIGPLTQDTVALYLRTDEPDLEARLDAWLLAQEESGALARLRARVLGAGNAAPTALPLDALLAATAERLALMPFVAAAKERTGKAVEDTAQEARVLEAGRAAVRKAAAEHGAAPPPDARVDAFFVAQIQAAKAVQQHVRADPADPAYSLADDLRPAIARVTARMAFLLVRLPRGLTPAQVQEKARDTLAGSGLEPGEIDRLAAPLTALAAD
jgi:cyclohexadienyl dehydratase